MAKVVDQLARSLKPLALVRVTVPSRDPAGRSVPSNRIRREIEDVLLAVASGTTTFRGRGTWRNGNSKPVREAILVVESYMPAVLNRRKTLSIASRLLEIARRTRQDALFVVVDGRPVLLPGT